MFTVKHRTPDGAETLYFGETVEVVQGKGHFDDGIFIDRDAIPLDPSDPDSPRASRHIIQMGGDATVPAQARKGGKVWVMNPAGATVATYDL